MFEVKTELHIQSPINYGNICIITNGVNVTQQVQYSWSFDKVEWTQWSQYSLYVHSMQYYTGDYYLKILTTPRDQFTIINNGEEYTYSTIIHSPNMFQTDACSVTNNCFDLYAGWECMMDAQQSISDHIVCTFGIPIKYFKVEPRIETASYTYKEYVMHNVVAVADLKMMIPDGTMPSSKPLLSDWDFDFEVDWEVELSKTQFASRFGDKAYPRSRDFIWVPMQNRMYEINSAYDEKNENLMWRSTTFTLALVKFNDATNISIDDDMATMIDSLIDNNYQETIFLEDELREALETQTHVLSSPNVPGNSLGHDPDSDDMREKVWGMEIEDDNIYSNGKVIAKHKYIPSTQAGVIYRNKFDACQGTLQWMFKTQKSIKFSGKLVEIGGINIYINNGVLDCNNLTHDLKPNTLYMNILQWDKGSMKYIYKLYEYKVNEKKEQFSNFIPISNQEIVYNNELDPITNQNITLTPLKLNVHMFRVYDEVVNMNLEMFKYTTTHKNCIVNDLCRPLTAGYGYAVR